MGIFLLIGLKTKNFILLITFMNKYRAKGESNWNAAYFACQDRFRPITMTSMIIVLGMLPPILIRSPSQADSVSLGIPIIAGVFSATFYSLYFLPACYVLFLKWSDSLADKFKRIMSR